MKKLALLIGLFLILPIILIAQAKVAEKPSETEKLKAEIIRLEQLIRVLQTDIEMRSPEHRTRKSAGKYESPWGDLRSPKQEREEYIEEEYYEPYYSYYPYYSYWYGMSWYIGWHPYWYWTNWYRYYYPYYSNYYYSGSQYGSSSYRDDVTTIVRKRQLANSARLNQSRNTVKKTNTIGKTYSSRISTSRISRKSNGKDDSPWGSLSSLKKSSSRISKSSSTNRRSFSKASSRSVKPPSARSSRSSSRSSRTTQSSGKVRKK